VPTPMIYSRGHMIRAHGVRRSSIVVHAVGCVQCSFGMHIKIEARLQHHVGSMSLPPDTGDPCHSCNTMTERPGTNEVPRARWFSSK
jgi:hypothetical protein